jgi:hypothetical protein
MKVLIEPGVYAQEIVGPKDIQRIFTNFYGAAPKNYFRTATSPNLTSLKLEASLGTKTK